MGQGVRISYPDQSRAQLRIRTIVARVENKVISTVLCLRDEGAQRLVVVEAEVSDDGVDGTARPGGALLVCEGIHTRPRVLGCLNAGHVVVCSTRVKILQKHAMQVCRLHSEAG